MADLTLPSNAAGLTGLHRISPPMKSVESTGLTFPSEHTHTRTTQHEPRLLPFLSVITACSIFTGTGNALISVAPPI